MFSRPAVWLGVAVLTAVATTCVTHKTGELPSEGAELQCGKQWWAVLFSFSPRIQEWLVLGATHAEHVHAGKVYALRSESVMADCNTLPVCPWDKRVNLLVIYPATGGDELYREQWCGGLIHDAGWAEGGWLTVYERNFDNTVSVREFRGW